MQSVGLGVALKGAIRRENKIFRQGQVRYSEFETAVLDSEPGYIQAVGGGGVAAVVLNFVRSLSNECTWQQTYSSSPQELITI